MIFLLFLKQIEFLPGYKDVREFIHRQGKAACIKRKILGLLQIAAAHIIVFWTFKGRTALTINRSGIRGLKPPFIVLGNHTSYFDPALVQFAVTRYPCYFLTTNFYFRHSLIGNILRFFGAIPKIQFFPDIRSTRGALTVLARGDIVGIFPEGRRSIDGSCCAIPASVARFIKKAKVPVISVKTNGGYFVWPRWSPFRRQGRIEIVAQQLLTVPEIESMDVEQLHNSICQAIAYNEYDWNRHAMVSYRHRHTAERLHLILHQCPRCLGEQKMRSKENSLYCIACGNKAILDEYGFLQPFDSKCSVFDDPVKWSAWQRENMLAQLRDSNFRLRATVKEIRVADKFAGSYRSCGYGYVCLYPDGLYFHGTVDNQPADLFFPIERTPSVSTEFGYDFEICDDKNAWWIFLDEEQQTVRLESAIALLHQLKHRCSSDDSAVNF